MLTDKKCSKTGVKGGTENFVWKVKNFFNFPTGGFRLKLMQNGVCTLVGKIFLNPIQLLIFMWILALTQGEGKKKER